MNYVAKTIGELTSSCVGGVGWGWGGGGGGHSIHEGGHSILQHRHQKS